jgi:hypothetical protein
LIFLLVASLDGKCFIVIDERCYVKEGNCMAKCPKCGKEVSTPKKTWKMAGRPDKSGKKTEITIGLFEHCGKSFRAAVGKRKI